MEYSIFLIASLVRSYSSYMENNLRQPKLILDARADNAKYRNECHVNVPLVPVKFLAERFGELNASDPNSLEVRRFHLGNTKSTAFLSHCYACAKETALLCGLRS